MNWPQTTRTALRGLSANKSRSLLTILGIVIGITAIMLVVALGAGAQELILGQIQGMGATTVVVLPGRQPTSISDAASIFLDSLKDNDLKAISDRRNVPTAADIMPIAFGSQRMTYGSETYQATVLGTGSETTDNVVSRIFDIVPSRGEFFTASDVRSRAAVAVIGDKVREKVFGNDDPLGQKFRIGSVTVKVVGILGKKGQVSFFNFDDMVLMPYTTVNTYILGRKHYDRFVVSARSEADINRTARDLEFTIRESHDITDPEKDDFHIETQADIAERLKTVTSALTAFLVAVASIALFVGGVGIMNIMLVSVTERTREIGLRKALGATNRDILTQFLLESVMLTAAGGIVGIILGTSLAFVVALALSYGFDLNWNFVFPWQGMFLGLGVSTLVGLVFGGYPAREAAKKSPIEALRYE
jgi:putative ABC transport system permease protein